MKFKRRFYRKFRYNRKRSFLFIFLFLLCLSFGLGYSLISTDLNIFGTTVLKDNRWSVYFDNIQEIEGSVLPTVEPEITDNTTVSFSAKLKNPGDKYEFLIDVVNDGTIDAKIGNISMSPILTTEQQQFFEYKVTYESGLDLNVNQALDAGSTETLKVSFKYLEQEDNSLYPSSDQTFNMTFTIEYVQGTGDELVHPYLYNVLEREYLSGGLVKKYTGAHKDSFTITGDKTIYYWNSDTTDNSSQVLEKNNVLFANYCWQIIRTTDTGGVKMIYNGSVSSTGFCNNTGSDSAIGKSKYNSFNNSPAYVGYMYNPNTLVSIVSGDTALENVLYGVDVTYDNGTYTLTDTASAYDGTHHYTCANATGVCSSVRYYYHTNSYVTLTDGRNIAQVLRDMLRADDVNQEDSTIKSFIDVWYSYHLVDFTSYLEDAIFCGDRKVKYYGAWKPANDAPTSFLQFNAFNASVDLNCENVTDQFSLSNPKAELTYPIGLIGYADSLLFSKSMRSIGVKYRLISPYYFNINRPFVRAVDEDGAFAYNDVDNNYYVRPVISLKPNTAFKSGDGSKNDPYLITDIYVSNA